MFVQSVRFKDSETRKTVGTDSGSPENRGNIFSPQLDVSQICRLAVKELKVWLSVV